MKNITKGMETFYFKENSEKAQKSKPVNTTFTPVVAPNESVAKMIHKTNTKIEKWRK